MFFEIGVISQDPQYAYSAIDPECDLTISQITLNTRIRNSAPSEIDERVALMVTKDPDLIHSGEKDLPITSFQEVYIPSSLKPVECSSCDVVGICPLQKQNTNPELRELFPRYLKNPQVLISVLLDSGDLFTKVVLPTLCQATPEELYMVGVLDDDSEYPDDDSPFSQRRLMSGLMDADNKENWIKEERYRASNTQFELTTPLLACMSCTLACPLKNQDGLELA